MNAKILLRAALVAALMASGLALAGDLPKLPKELTLATGGDSPGVVAFRHDSHVDGAKPGCLTCHAERFSILGAKSPAKREKITHAAMDKGAACGACHGKQAFGFDDCTMCHAQ